MSNSSLYFAVAVILLSSLPSAVQAQALCLKRETMIKELKKQFNEVPISIGLAGDKIIEIFASPNGETFTIIFTTKEGITCPIAAGEDWVNSPVPSKDSLNIINPVQLNG
jgi:hypothetical protein